MNTVDGLLRDFEVDLKGRRLEPTTVSLYLGDISKILDATNYQTGFPIDNASEFREALKNGMRALEEQGYSTNTIKRAIASVNAFIKYLRREGYLEHFALFRTPKNNSHIMVSSPPDFDKMLQATEGTKS